MNCVLPLSTIQPKCGFRIANIQFPNNQLTENEHYMGGTDIKVVSQKIGRCSTCESGRPEESHLQSPSEPCVNLSIHTAPASLPLETSRSQAYAKRTRLRGAHPHLLCSYAHFILKVRSWRTWRYQIKTSSLFYL